jgi:hypothetical protein
MGSVARWCAPVALMVGMVLAGCAGPVRPPPAAELAAPIIGPEAGNIATCRSQWQPGARLACYDAIQVAYLPGPPEGPPDAPPPGSFGPPAVRHVASLQSVPPPPSVPRQAPIRVPPRVTAAPPISAEPEPQPSGRRSNDAQIVAAIIRQSRNAYYATGHPCACPYDRARNGSSCGGRSAYSRPGGAEPLCFPNDVTSAAVAEWKAHHSEPVASSH